MCMREISCVLVEVLTSKNKWAGLYRCFCEGRCEKKDRVKSRNIGRQSNTHTRSLAYDQLQQAAWSELFSGCFRQFLKDTISVFEAQGRTSVSVRIYILESNTETTNHCFVLNIQPIPPDTTWSCRQELMYIWK